VAEDQSSPAACQLSINLLHMRLESHCNAAKLIVGEPTLPINSAHLYIEVEAVQSRDGDRIVDEAITPRRLA